MTRVDLPSRWSPMPHALTSDYRVCDSAARLYSLLYKCGWEHRDIADVADLASLWPRPPDAKPPVARSFYRWLAELADTGWIEYDRKPGQRGLGDRLKLHNESTKPLILKSEALTPESEAAQTSDFRIRGSDRRVRASDPKVRGRGEIAQQDAMKNRPQIFRKDLPEDPEPPPPQSQITDRAHGTPAAPAGGGGGPAASASPIGRTTPQPAPPGAVYLIREGFSAAAAATWGHLPVELLRTEVERWREQGSGPGAIVKAWRVAPPDSAPATEGSRTPTTDLAARLRAQLQEAAGPPPAERATPPARAAPPLDAALRQAWQLAQLELSYEDRQWLLGASIRRDGSLVTIIARSIECQQAIATRLTASIRQALREQLGGATQLRVIAGGNETGRTTGGV